MKLSAVSSVANGQVYRSFHRASIRAIQNNNDQQVSEIIFPVWSVERVPSKLDIKQIMVCDKGQARTEKGLLYLIRRTAIPRLMVLNVWYRNNKTRFVSTNNQIGSCRIALLDYLYPQIIKSAVAELLCSTTLLL